MSTTDREGSGMEGTVLAAMAGLLVLSLLAGLAVGWIIRLLRTH